MASQVSDRFEGDGRTTVVSADSPTQLPASGWRATLKRTFKEMKDDRVSLVAAGVAFFWFLAIFPLLIAAVGILALVNAAPSFVEAINEGIRSTLPGGAASVLSNAITAAQQRAGDASLAAAGIAILLALWSASSGMAAAQVGLDVAYDVPRDRPWLKKRLMGILLIFLALLLGGVATALLVFGKPLGDALSRTVSAGEWFLVVWNVVRWLVTILAIATLFALFYYIGPNRQPPSWKWISPGGVVATLIWLAASVGFSFYVSNFGGTYGETYGSLAGVVILVLWLYLSALALLAGGELNGELERQKQLHEQQRSSSALPT